MRGSKGSDYIAQQQKGFWFSITAAAKPKAAEPRYSPVPVVRPVAWKRRGDYADRRVHLFESRRRNDRDHTADLTACNPAGRNHPETPGHTGNASIILGGTMKLPKFVLGLLGVLIAFFIATLILTGSFWTAILESILCAILVQVGYFAVVLFMIARTRTNNADEEASPAREGAQDEPPRPAKIGILQSLRRHDTLK